MDLDSVQAESNSPLAIFTLASSSVRAVNRRTRPVALCRTVHIIGGPFSAVWRDKNRRALSKRLPDVRAFRDKSSHSSNESGMAIPQAKAARPIAARFVRLRGTVRLTRLCPKNLAELLLKLLKSGQKGC